MLRFSSVSFFRSAAGLANKVVNISIFLNVVSNYGSSASLDLEEAQCCLPVRPSVRSFVSPSVRSSILWTRYFENEGIDFAWISRFSYFIVSTPCSKKHVTTSSTISWTRIVPLQPFWHIYYQDNMPSTDVFIFPPHLFSAATLPWETVTGRCDSD